jgi:hypothetical protein
MSSVEFLIYSRVNEKWPLMPMRLAVNFYHCTAKLWKKARAF